jgi:hypothetical protein
MDKNLSWRPDGAPVKFEGKTFDQWRAGGSDLHSVVADPGFASLESGDFTLKSDSPAFKIGFEPFKLPLIGRGAVDYTMAVTAAMRHKGPGRMTAVKVPRVVAKRVSAPITIDGKLTEKVWQEAKAVPLTFTKAAAPHEQPWSRSLVLWDGENLYVAIVTDVPDMSKLHYDIATYQYPDHAAVSFQGVAGDQATAIYILRGWIGGTLECALDEWKTDESVKALQKGAAFAANAGNNEWTAELKIPLAFDGVDLRPMKEIRFNMGVRRSEAPDKDRKWGMWADTGADAWRLRDAGLLILEKQ